jgi:uncharacterized membrane protein YhaH (DUF805 family)
MLKGMVTIVREIFAVKGRLNRKAYATYWVFVTVLSLAILMASPVAEAHLISPNIGVIICIGVVIICVFAHVCLAIRRLHDLDRHGAIAFGLFVSLINIILIMYLFFQRGTIGFNKYGPDPLGGIE